MKVLVTLGVVAYQIYKVIFWLAQFLSCVFVILCAIFGVKMLLEGWRETKLDRKQRAAARAAQSTGVA